MSTIAAIFELSADGTLHLPVPPAWKGLPIRVRAELEPVLENLEPVQQDALKGFGCLKGKITMAPDFDALDAAQVPDSPKHSLVEHLRGLSQAGMTELPEPIRQTVRPPIDL